MDCATGIRESKETGIVAGVAAFLLAVMLVVIPVAAQQVKPTTAKTAAHGRTKPTALAH